MVTIPETLTKPEDRAAYLVTHYWDHFDFGDTAYIHLPEVTEQAFVDYLDILPHTDKQTADQSIQNMLKECINHEKTGKMYGYFLSLYKSYLHDPNSPFRSEELYLPVSEYIIGDKISDEVTKERAKFDHSMILKNRAGTKANDFSYVTIKGKKGSLYALGKSYTILYFYNPDCTACKETSLYLQNSPVINKVLEDGTADLLAIYPDDELNLWQAYANKISNLWINAHDVPRIITNKRIYDLRALPCIYLLDKDKNVLLKDANAKIVEQYLTDIINR